tara:strand:- start:1019 stop:1624 length:606 start_codon:yes stop_codon:yes gene_type:complete
MLLAQNITLSRSGRKIFEDISLSLTSGKIVIIKGRNGSGKTSFLKTILNILEPSSGSIYWKGKIINKNLYDYYKNVTYISDKTSSIRQLSVYENIKIWKKIFLSDVSYKQIENILSILNIKIYLDTKVNSLSLGEIKKLELLRLIIENKKIWILDEPFTNLDIESIEMISQTFMDHSNNNGCIIFSSHQKPQVELSEEINL